MPIALDPTQTVDVVLALDSEKPEPRPTFICRHLSCRDVIKVGELTRQAYEQDKKAGDDNNAETNALLNQILTIQLVGWKNIDTPFSTHALDDVLTPLEKWELIRLASSEVQIDFMLKKKLLWLRRSATENSVKSATPNASATNPPGDTTASTSPASSAAATGQ